MLLKKSRTIRRMLAGALSASLLITAVPGIFPGRNPGAVEVSAAQPQVSVRATAEQRKDFADNANPYENYLFADGYTADELLVSGTDLKAESTENGLMISGKNKDVKAGAVTIKKIYDFGTGCATRVRIDALAKRGTKTTLDLYLDEAAAPFLSARLKLQPTDDVWTDPKAIFYEIPAGAVTGRHYITIRINDQDTADTKNAKTLVRGIRFYKESVPTVNLSIDESYTPIADMNGDEQHITECYGSVTIKVPKGYRSDYSEEGQTDYNGGTYKLDYIRGRGNSTWTVEKKPYKNNSTFPKPSIKKRAFPVFIYIGKALYNTKKRIRVLFLFFNRNPVNSYPPIIN